MFKAIKEYFSGIISELKKTTWPDRRTLISYTIIVVASSVLAVILLTVIDLGLTKGIEYIVNNKQGL